jgi:autonomous glycyl radical cofactor GrcA
LGQRHIFCTQRLIKDANKTVLGYYWLIDDASVWICKQCASPIFEGDVVDAIQKLVVALDVRVENVREVALAY